MAALTLAAVRQRVATACAGVSGWTESTVPIDVFGRDPNTAVHQSFVVGVGQLTTAGGRQRRAVGARVESQVRVSWAWRLQPKNQIASYDAALAGQVALIIAAMGVSLADLHVLLDGASAPVVSPPGEFIRGEFQILATFILALE